MVVLNTLPIQHFTPRYSRSFAKIKELYLWGYCKADRTVPLSTQTHLDKKEWRAQPSILLQLWMSCWPEMERSYVLSPGFRAGLPPIIPFARAHKRHRREKETVVHLHNLDSWKLKILITLLILYWNEKTAYQQLQPPAQCLGSNKQQIPSKGSLKVKIMLNLWRNILCRPIIFHFA